MLYLILLIITILLFLLYSSSFQQENFTSYYDHDTTLMGYNEGLPIEFQQITPQFYKRGNWRYPNKDSSIKDSSINSLVWNKRFPSLVKYRYPENLQNELINKENYKQKKQKIKSNCNTYIMPKLSGFDYDQVNNIAFYAGKVF